MRDLGCPFESRWRERGGGLIFALVFNALLIIALLTLGPRPAILKPDPRMPVTFEMAPAPAAEKRSAKREEAAAAIRVPRPVEKPVERPIVELPPTPSPFLVLDSQQMASADIGRMPKKAAGSGAAGQGDSKAVTGPGEGPGGVQLFEAEWYRRPTHAELSSYLPQDAPPNGWGLVACRTVDHYHVENCQALGESPLGSGFARAVRLAAWQFLVRPPRVDGKPLVGSWVRIRIDYTRRAASQGGSPEAGQ